MTRVKHLAVVGTGLIGASVGLAAQRAGVNVVTGWDPDSDARDQALERGAITGVSSSLADAVDGADLALVAAPVAQLVTQVSTTLELSASSCTVTDVGSTKSAICDAVGERERYIGGHPMAGSEARGPQHATGELFNGATWFLTPVDETRPERYKLLHAFVSGLGAVPVAIAPAAHDRLVALTSHLPHALANQLLNQAGLARIDGHEPLAAAAGSLRDMTRVAGANARIWVDIFLENADALTEMLGQHRRGLEDLEAALQRRDGEFIARWIGQASDHRRRLLEEAYPDAGQLHRLEVHVSDRPGVFAAITQALASEGINIEDFEVHHLSPERGGTLDLLVGETDAERAARLLEEHGYAVIVAPVVADDALE
ncbi:MAG: prephenate dehydrogenase/arogenate dehydrogenase family protein [Gaiellaceae bacterium]